ncbi:MAG: hypothetical protein ACE5I1_02500 [bacterium]
MKEHSVVDQEALAATVDLVALKEILVKGGPEDRFKIEIVQWREMKDRWLKAAGPGLKIAGELLYPIEQIRTEKPCQIRGVLFASQKREEMKVWKGRKESMNRQKTMDKNMVAEGEGENQSLNNRKNE